MVIKDTVKENILINGRIRELEYNTFEKDIDNLIKNMGVYLLRRN